MLYRSYHFRVEYWLPCPAGVIWAETLHTTTDDDKRHLPDLAPIFMRRGIRGIRGDLRMAIDNASSANNPAPGEVHPFCHHPSSHRVD